MLVVGQHGVFFDSGTIGIICWQYGICFSSATTGICFGSGNTW